MNMKTNGEKVFSEIDGLYQGDVPLLINEGEPSLRWMGAKIPYDKFCEWVAFARWGKAQGMEIQLKPLYNETTNEWSELVLYQECTAGGTNTNLPNGKEDDVLPTGFSVVGSFHSHPGSAFQSGTDHKDETDMSEPGLHITVGDLNKKEIDIHYRLIFRRFEYEECNISDWVDSGSAINADYGLELADRITDYLIRRPASYDFPLAWKDKVRKKTYRVTHAIKYTGVKEIERLAESLTKKAGDYSVELSLCLEECQTMINDEVEFLEAEDSAGDKALSFTEKVHHFIATLTDNALFLREDVEEDDLEEFAVDAGASEIYSLYDGDNAI